MNKWTAVVLAAGKGTRMKSNLPKVLHPVMGKPMVLHVVDKSYQAGAENVLAIVGFGGESVEAVLTGKARVVEQKEQLGTGHAVQQCIPALENYQGDVMILCGDTPLLRVETLSDLMDKHQKSGASATVLTALLDNPMGYGRILRSDSGQVLGIVEEKDATEVQRKVQEINTGIYCFKSLDLVEALKSLTNDNAQGEYYLTDTLAYLNKVDKPVGAQILLDEDESLGVNSRVQLAQAEQILRQRKNLELMENGVTLMDPATTYVDEDVEVGPDTVIYPSTWLEGRTQIGSNCEIGPNTRLKNVKIGESVTIQFTYGHDCIIDDNVAIGPYVHLRPGTHLKKGVKVGNFMEIKNSIIGEKTKLNHLSYIGDADLGANINIGCGTITVNYDGKNKFRTTIEDRAFIGCNSNLVAPVTIGEGAFIAAGSTITKDVPSEALGVARAKQSNIEGWAQKKK